MSRTAVLGSGCIGSMYAENVEAHPRGTLGGIYDLVSSVSTEAAQWRRMPALDGAEGAFASKNVDTVLIATAPPRPADLMEAALAADRPLLCVEPIDLSLVGVNGRAERSKGTTSPTARCDRRVTALGPLGMGQSANVRPQHRVPLTEIQTGAAAPRLDVSAERDRDPFIAKTGVFVDRVQNIPAPLSSPKHGPLALLTAEAAIKCVAECRAFHTYEIG